MNEMLLLAELLKKHRLETQEKDKRIAELEEEEVKNERTIKNMGLAIALAQEWTQEKDAKIAELEKSLIAPTDSGVVALDSICEKFNSNKESDLTELTCSIWNKAYFEALKE